MKNKLGIIVMLFVFMLAKAVSAADVGKEKTVELGGDLDGEWTVLACHPSRSEITLSRQYIFGSPTGFAETLRIGVGDTVQLNWPGPNRAKVRAKLMQYDGTGFDTCSGRFSIR